MRRAIIFGNGMDRLPCFQQYGKRTIDTRFGSVDYYEDDDLILLPRHGLNHEKNVLYDDDYKANIYALSLLDVWEVIEVFCAGSLSDRILPGECGLLDSFISFSQDATFGDMNGNSYTDMSAPYDSKLREPLRKALFAQKLFPEDGLVYFSSKGPRFQTGAEVKAFKMLGGDVVGQLAASETTLLRELNISTVAVVFSSNWAAGIHRDDEVKFIDNAALMGLAQRIFTACYETCKSVEYSL